MTNGNQVKTYNARARVWVSMKHIFFTSTCIALTACATTYEPSGEPQLAQEDIQDFPYNPLTYHLDLSVLAYQLYAQTLVWPIDPYYEDQNNWDWDREKMLEKVRAWAVYAGQAQTGRAQSLADYRGPGILNGFTNDPAHDPILYRYSQLNPWSNSLSRASGTWTEARTPKAITDPVRDVYMCSRRKGEGEDQGSITRLQPIASNPRSGGRDVILAFEGETGDKGEPGQAGSQSLLGYALVRHQPNSEKFDVHVVFRGSRSGSAGRALLQAFSDGNAKGNPDWITDLGYDLIDSGEARNSVTTTGKVFRGFTHSMAASSPHVIGCLDYINTINPGRSPERVFVTGHSLGGGLAQHFVSSVLMGDRYGPSGQGHAMPKSLQKWPWRNIKLVSFSAPRAGDETWAKTLTETQLKSDFFSTRLNPFDPEALAGNDPQITKRLLNADMPAGYRVLISRDPITTGRGIEGKHVGKTVYVNKVRSGDALRAPDVSAHEPLNVRELLVSRLSDPRIPVWDTEPGRGLEVKLSKEDVGTEAGYRKLKSEYKSYYSARDIPFNQITFDRDFELFLSILSGDQADSAK